MSYRPRPVTIVEAGYKKPMDLQIVTVVDSFQDLPGETIWPSVIPNVLNDIRRHRSTLVFCNNRRLAERTADRLNAQLEAEQSEEIPPGSTEALAPGGVARDRGMFAIGATGPIKAHHGSTSKEARRQMEEELKAGKLPALIGTSSLELGIDIGAVDLVVQLQSPKSVSQGLQRVGRSGHLVGQTSVGRIYATFREDLLEAAAIARGMLEGDVEPTYTPLHPLDVLAQQIVAMVSAEDWQVERLFNLVRQAYAYRALSWETYLGVLEMLSGRYHLQMAQKEKGEESYLPESVKPALSAATLGLKPRISLGPGEQPAVGAARLAAAGHHQRRHHPRHRHVRRLPGRRQDQARRTGRGVHLRDAPGRHVPAGQPRVARGGHGRAAHHGGRRDGRDAAHAVLERRLPVAAV